MNSSLTRHPRLKNIGIHSALIPAALLVLGLLLGPAFASAQTSDIREFRGPFDPDIPKPEEILGFMPGDDFRLADWPSILEYLRTLDEASEYMALEEIGTSTLGQPLVLALISNPRNLEHRERYRSIAERLARAKNISPEIAAQLAADGKAIVWIDSGLHASEVAHGQHAPELAYLMTAGTSDKVRRIRDDVILLLMPNMNPDGLNIVADWYRSNLGTPYETANLPVLYHKYVGHDNNRDWYMITQSETASVSRVLYHQWYPQIVYNHHQSAPFPARIFVPPFAEPANPNIPPLVLRGIERVGNSITTGLEAEGKAGAVSRLGFTAWWNGGMRTVPYFHNMVGILTETALFRYATPNFYPPSELPNTFRNGLSTRDPSMAYPMPWKGGWWRLRDPIEYMLTASLATLDIASRHREEWLLNTYRMASRAVARGTAGSPAAWVIPPEQRDPGAATELVNVLMRGGLEVEIAPVDFSADGVQYPAGTYVVPAAQAFRNYAVDLLEPQSYPDRRLYPGGPPDPPYDIAGWTLPFQMGVDVDRVEAPFQAKTEPITVPAVTRGSIVGSGATYVLDPSENSTAQAILQLLNSGDEVYWSAEPVGAAGTIVSAGAVIVPDAPGVGGRLMALAGEVGITVRATNQRPRGNGWRLQAPRIALYEPWVANMDAGWTRWLLERYNFPYVELRDAVARKGRLREQFDVIILPSASEQQLVEGHGEDSMPVAYTGGLGEAGIDSLREFVADGGTLICLDAAGELAIERLGVPVRNVLFELDRTEFFCPGSLLRITLDNTHPVAFGMAREGTASFVRSAAYSFSEDVEGPRRPLRAGDDREGVKVVAAYPDGKLLRSGWILGEEHLNGRAAVVEITQGKGRIILLGFRTQFRAQPHGTFKLLFNSLLYATATSATLP